MANDAPYVFAVGILGNLVSFCCFLAPVPTFYRVCKKKTTEGFQSLPYVAALFTSMLWIFYAYIKTGEILLITINAFGCFIETVYLVIYITYCPRKARFFTFKMIFLFNVGVIFLVVLLTHVLAKERTARIELLGWICVVLSTSVFAAPLSIIKVVIRTKSVEFMPITLSLLLTVSAIMWLAYGILLRDIYVTLPNFVGITFGTIQIVLYFIYRKHTPSKDQKLPEHKDNATNEENANTAVSSENHAANSGGFVDIEIGEKKGVKKVEEAQKKQDQTENKTREASTQQVQHN
ncbi:bidirectional sugar transporter N3-like [Vigna unguiculata]|uniref:Bidirectional sugar transporter SWEET n=1 Tax=Vigna unguiculata TaxID=3917 RepID=A0A4D6L9B3_VIGUN|nr:bidirectional sugar transporter N3-like [Vigna unguiculata]QCD84984.1 Bidirectional sugar transporter SWEET10-like [Vigna unguiculata]